MKYSPGEYTLPSWLPPSPASFVVSLPPSPCFPHILSSHKSNEGSIFKNTKTYQLASKSYICALNPNFICKKQTKAYLRATSCHPLVLHIQMIHSARQLAFHGHRSHNQQAVSW